MSFSLVFASAGRMDVSYDGSRYMSIELETGDFQTYQFTEDDQEYVRYAFTRSNNAKHEDQRIYDILQFPLAIAGQIPEISVSVLETQDYEHTINDNELFKISDVRQYRDRDFVYVTINPFLKNSRVASKLLINVDLRENAGSIKSNKYNKFFINSEFANALQTPSSTVPILKKTSSFSGEWLDVRVDEEGLFTIDRNDIQSAGISASFDDENVYLFAGPAFGGPLRNEFPDSVDFHLKQVPLLYFAGASASEDQWVFYATANSFWKRQSDISDIRNVEYKRNSYEDDQHFRLFIGNYSEDALRMEQDIPVFSGSEIDQDYAYHRLHMEEELINPAKGGELWFGERLSSSEVYSFYLNNLYSGNAEAALRLSFGMTTAGTHEFSTYVGDSLVNVISASLGKNANDYDYESSLVRRQQLLLANSALSENFDIRLAYQSNLPTGEGFLDYIDIIYPVRPEAVDGQLNLWFMASEDDRRIDVSGLNTAISYVFEVEDPFSVNYYPINGSSGNVLVSSSDVSNSFMIVNESHFKSPANISLLPDFKPLVSEDHESQTDFIIITPDTFLSEADRLANFKESRSIQPLTTQVKTYSEIIGQYNAGNRDPYAIWHYLVDMYSQAPDPKPMYVLLLGDGHYDYQNRLFSTPSYIPHLYEKGVLWPCDDIYVMVNSPEDLSNDMAIGRIPANSYDEVKAAIDKIIEYDGRENPGEWQLNTMLVADDPADPTQDRYTDRVFIYDSEDIHNYFLPDVMHTKKVYLTDYPERYITELQTMGRDGAREDIYGSFP